MSDDSGLNEEFDAALDDLLPEEVDPNEVATDGTDDDPTRSPGNRNWGVMAREWHALREVDPHRRDELAEREIDHYVDELDLPDPVEGMAGGVFDQYVAAKDHLIVELTAAAAVYAAAKVNEFGVTPDDVVEVATGPLDRTVLLRRSKDVVGELGLDPSAFFDATMYVDRFCEELDAPEAVVERAKEILEYCDEAGISGGKSPTGWAAAAIYNAYIEGDHGENITQNDLADVADVTSVTIRNRYQEQRELVLRQERPDEIDDLIAWACSRIGVPDRVRAEALSIPETVPEIDGRLPDGAPARLADDPAGWGTAAIKLAADREKYPLNYRPLKTLSGFSAGELERRVRALDRAAGSTVAE